MLPSCIGSYKIFIFPQISNNSQFCYIQCFKIHSVLIRQFRNSRIAEIIGPYQYGKALWHTSKIFFFCLYSISDRRTEILKRFARRAHF